MASTVSHYRPWRVLVPMLLGVLLLVGWTFWPGLSNAPQLGLDLQGGTQVTLLPTTAPGTDGHDHPGAARPGRRHHPPARGRPGCRRVRGHRPGLRGQRGDHRVRPGLGVPGPSGRAGRAHRPAGLPPGRGDHEPGGCRPERRRRPRSRRPSVTPTPTEASPTPTDASTPAPSASPTDEPSPVSRTVGLRHGQPEREPQRQPGGGAAEDPGPGRGERPRSSRSAPCAWTAPSRRTAPGSPDDQALWLATCDREGTAKYLLQPAFIKGTQVTNATAAAGPADQQVVGLADLRHRGRQGAGRDLHRHLRQPAAAEPVRHRPRRRGLQRPVLPRADPRRAAPRSPVTSRSTRPTTWPTC